MPDKKWLLPILPYIAVVAGMHLFKNAWIALLGFHASILIMLAIVHPGVPKWILISVLVCSTSGFGLYFLWNMLGITPDLSAQLATLGLRSPTSWLLFITYFSLVNPFIEEYFWRGYLGSNSKKLYLGDAVYAGYHGLILWGKVHPVMILLALIGLTSVGWFWRQISREDEGLLAAVLGHMVADFSILFVVYLMCT
jgi:membrane protease YdiL (CAAX protease family)